MNDAVRWLKIDEAADRARCGPKTIYRAVRSGQLRAARIGGRRELRFLESWIDCWLLGEDSRLEPGLPTHGQIGSSLGMSDATGTRRSTP